MFPIVWFALPESVEFLVARQPRRALERVNRLLYAQGLEPLAVLPGVKERRSAPPVGRLFAQEFRAETLLLWGAFFASFFTLYFLTSWIPRIAVIAGFPLGSAVTGSATFNLGAFFGLVLLGALSAQLDLAKLIGMFFILAAAMMALFGVIHQPEIVFFIILFVIGFLVQGGFGGLYAVAARVYPAEVKATGLGSALGVGRLGAIGGPAVGGVLLSADFGLAAIFAVFALPMLLAAFLALRVAKRHQTQLSARYIRTAPN
jgi:predicted MFS family arabinose efflux permease